MKKFLFFPDKNKISKWNMQLFCPKNVIFNFSNRLYITANEEKKG